MWCEVRDRFHSAASSALSSRNFEKSAMPWQLSTWHSASAANVHALRGIGATAPSAAQLVHMLSEVEVVDPSEGTPMGGAVSDHDSDDLSD